MLHKKLIQTLATTSIVCICLLTSSPFVSAADYSTSTANSNAALANVGDTEFLALRSGHPQILVLDTPASNIVVGNPNSLTVSLLDPLHLLLTPKARGSGNLILLDEEKNIIQSFEVAVDITSRTRTVTIHRAMAGTNYDCSSTDCVTLGAK